MTAAIQTLLERFQADLDTATDPKVVMRSGEAFLSAVEALPKAAQAPYKADIARLVAVLETRILALEQALKDQQT